VGHSVYKEEKVGTTQVQQTKYTLCLVLTVCAAALSIVNVYLAKLPQHSAV